MEGMLIMLPIHSRHCVLTMSRSSPLPPSSESTGVKLPSVREQKRERERTPRARVDGAIARARARAPIRTPSGLDGGVWHVAMYRH